MTAPGRTPRQQNLDRLGRVLTWLTGLAGALIAVPVLILGCLALVVGGGEPTGDGSGLPCREGCRDDFKQAGIVGLSFVVVVGTLIYLAVASTRRTLIVATALSLVVTVGLALYAAGTLTGSVNSESAWMALTVAALAGLFCLGSALRLWSRPRPD